jgi:hypothetical protein
MPTSVARLIDRGSQPNSTAAVKPAATSKVAPMCPAANVIANRPLRYVNSATASRQTSPGSHT